MFGIKVLEEQNSKFNGTLRAVKPFLGRPYIQAEGLTQSGGIVFDMWRSTLAKVKKLSPRDCLILGFGGGSVSVIVKKMWLNTKIYGLDIDSQIVEMGRKYLGFPENADITIEDADHFLDRNKLKYDLIIVDLYNGGKLPAIFSDRTFLVKVYKSLESGGYAIFNRLSLKSMPETSRDFSQDLEKLFKKVTIYKPLVNTMYICQK